MKIRPIKFVKNIFEYNFNITGTGKLYVSIYIELRPYIRKANIILKIVPMHTRQCVQMYAKGIFFT